MIIECWERTYAVENSEIKNFLLLQTNSKALSLPSSGKNFRFGILFKMGAMLKK